MRIAALQDAVIPVPLLAAPIPEEIAIGSAALAACRPYRFAREFAA